MFIGYEVELANFNPVKHSIQRDHGELRDLCGIMDAIYSEDSWFVLVPTLTVVLTKCGLPHSVSPFVALRIADFDLASHRRNHGLALVISPSYLLSPRRLNKDNP